MRSMTDVVSLVVGVLGVAVGGFITWAVARHFYVAAARDLNTAAEGLRAETQRTRYVVRMLVDYLEEAGVVHDVKRDPNTGELIVMHKRGLKGEQPSAHGSLTYEVTRAPVFPNDEP